MVVPTHLQKLDRQIGSISTVEVENKKYLKAQNHVLLDISIPTPSSPPFHHTRLKYGPFVRFHRPESLRYYHFQRQCAVVYDPKSLEPPRLPTGLLSEEIRGKLRASRSPYVLYQICICIYCICKYIYTNIYICLWVINSWWLHTSVFEISKYSLCDSW